MSFTIEEAINTQALTEGDMVTLTWEIPYDVPTSAVTFDMNPGPTLTGDDLEKSNIGPTDEWGGRDTFRYRASRVQLVARFTRVQATTDGANHATTIQAEPKLTS